ncbi:MAG TPA: hypothetical protein EYN71_06110 [Flavobacteriales bacterium]|nr:hypothetical protein [Flavobacteriales bacterium]
MLSSKFQNALKYVVAAWLILSTLHAEAQKAWYSKSEINWETVEQPEHAPIYTIYLIGDAGEADFSKPAALKVLEGHLEKADSNALVVFLGDNIYKAGLPDTSSDERGAAERKINVQLDILDAFQGKIVFVPGNHDWDHWRPAGLVAIKREESYIEHYLDRGNTFLPDKGCPGPAVTNLTDNLVFIAIDTQWWLHKWDKVNVANEVCTAIDDDSFIKELDKVLEANKSKQIIVGAHHPIITNGYHGGRFTIKDHLFPLTAKYHNLYLPMPILGSIYPMSRKYFGHIQDVTHPRYRLLIKQLSGVFSKYDNLIFAAGHDHNLQYFAKERQHYIVSGSGCKTSHVAKGHQASFTYARQGFVKLKYYSNRDVLLEVWVTNDSIDNIGHVAYRKLLEHPTSK